MEKYPQDREIIVKSVIGDNNKYIESGANTLAKYGYTSKTSDLIDKSENKVKMMIIFFVFLFAVFSIIILVIAIKAMGYVLKIFESMYYKMKNIFNTVDNIKHSNVFLFAVFSIIILVIAIKAMGYVLKIFESMYYKMKNIFNTVDNIKHSNTLNKNDNKTDNALQERESIENDSVDLNKYNENLLCRINMISEKAERNMRINMRKIENEKENVKSLVTDISHQLKTPLANVELYNTLLAEGGISDEERLEFLETEGIAIEKLKMLVDSLINISRLEADMISIDKKEENLKECIESAISSVKADAAKKNITIKNDIKEDCILAIDRKWTTEAIFNLLDNAVKYTAPNGKINLSLDNGINYFALNIEDNGIGIDTDEYNDIFKRFYRSRNDIVQNEKGSGVGLYLVRKIMNLQDGNVMVSSEKGKGSTFTLYFSKSKGE